MVRLQADFLSLIKVGMEVSGCVRKSETQHPRSWFTCYADSAFLV